MGGCRCTYRNCTMKSDGRTHMFHYPVFEKVRCHQWLLNAHRLDFLDLKVSQLKNRVVCQHHFKDENFMNFKKGKLTFDAIPTEDGPYCDTTNYVHTNQDLSNLYSIIIDDTENEYITGSGKKANFSLKYGDFLTNLDLMDIEKTEQPNTNHELKNCDLNTLSLAEKDKVPNADGSIAIKLSLPDKSKEKTPSQTTLIVPPYVNPRNTSLTVAPRISRSSDSNNISSTVTQDISVGNKIVPKEQIKQQRSVKKESKVKIISEKKIRDPVTISGKLEPVSPSFIVNMSKKRDDSNRYTKMPTKHIIEVDIEKETNKLVEIELEPIKEEDLSQSSSTNVIQNIILEKPPKVSLMKPTSRKCASFPLSPKVTPERVEAINKKRKFNMKLRDIIETCLDKLENSDKITEEITPVEKTEMDKQVQHTNVSKTSHLPPTQDYTIAFLESRLKKMENNLLHKIDQNSKKINDIKKVYTDHKHSHSRTDEEKYKRHLFREISKFLSPSSKSVVYEELFINKFSPSADSSDKRKRQRCI